MNLKILLYKNEKIRNKLCKCNRSVSNLVSQIGILELFTIYDSTSSSVKSSIYKRSNAARVRVKEHNEFPRYIIHKMPLESRWNFAYTVIQSRFPADQSPIPIYIYIYILWRNAHPLPIISCHNSPIIFRGFNRVLRLLCCVSSCSTAARSSTRSYYSIPTPFEHSFLSFLYFTVPFKSHDNNDPNVYRQKARNKTRHTAVKR